VKVYGAVADAPVKVICGGVEFWQTAVVPAIVAVGKGFTVTFSTAGLAAAHPKTFWHVTVTVCGPLAVQRTVAVLSTSEPPKITVPPGVTVHT
jgi:hypothetical protein